jgi:hypothetical protein
VKRPTAVRKDLIARTQQTWRRRFQREISTEEARQIIENITGFFDILAEWSGDARASAKASGGEAAGSNANDKRQGARR